MVKLLEYFPFFTICINDDGHVFILDHIVAIHIVIVLHGIVGDRVLVVVEDVRVLRVDGGGRAQLNEGTKVMLSPRELEKNDGGVRSGSEGRLRRPRTLARPRRAGTKARSAGRGVPMGITDSCRLQL